MNEKDKQVSFEMQAFTEVGEALEVVGLDRKLQLCVICIKNDRRIHLNY